VLVFELIATEIWKEKVFPEVLDLQLEQELLFPIYIVVGIIFMCLLINNRKKTKIILVMKLDSMKQIHCNLLATCL